MVVTKTEDTDDGLCSGDDCSLREAIVTANSCPDFQSVDIPAGTYNLTIDGVDEDEARSGDLDILDSMSLKATGGEVVIDAGGEDRVFHITDPVEDSPDVVHFDGLTIQGGLADFTGGGIYLQEGWLSLDNSVVRSNQAGTAGSVGGAGGGIYSEAHLTTSNSGLEGNVAYGPGGGLYLDDSASLLVNDQMTLIGNQALGGEGGGGIFNRGDAEFSGELRENEAVGDGAGFWNGGDLTIRTGTFSFNSGGVHGGGLFNARGGSAILYESWFTNNSADLGGGLFNQGLVHLYQSGVNTNTAFRGFGGGVYNDGTAAALLVRNTTISRNMIDPFDRPGGSAIYNGGGDLQIEFATFANNNADAILNDGGHGNLESTILAGHSLGTCTGDPLNSNGHNLEHGSDCNLDESSDLADTNPLIGRLASNGGHALSHLPAPGSPAIDTGDRDTCIANDQRSVARPQGGRCDRGSVEVQAGEGESAPDSGTATPDPSSAEIDINFNADLYVIEEGECTTLRWQVTGATTVSLLGQEIEHTEAHEVCPDETTGYTLNAENETDEQSAFLEIEVTEPTDDLGCIPEANKICP